MRPIPVAFVWLTALGSAFAGCSVPDPELQVKAEDVARLREMRSFRFPLENYYPDRTVSKVRSEDGRFHAGEDSYAKAGTPVYAIGDGEIRYSGRAKGYGWLIIIDHPKEKAYSLYGHLSRSRWRKTSGKVTRGECIAHIGDAEEGETGASHLHFGIRKGQKGDYWRFGDGRWMAGWIKARPEGIGWLELSKIVEPTEYIQGIELRDRSPGNYAASSSPLRVRDFRITERSYGENEDPDRMVRKEFGEAYRMADWNDILLFRDRIESWADSAGILEGNAHSMMVSRDGHGFWRREHYFIARFNHNKPAHFAAYENIDNHFICLGRWHDLNKRILAVRR